MNTRYKEIKTGTGGLSHVPAACPPQRISMPTYGRPEEQDRKEMIKCALLLSLLLSPNLPSPIPTLGSGRTKARRDILLKKRKGQARETGACTEHHPWDGVLLGDLLLICDGQEEKGWVHERSNEQCP